MATEQTQLVTKERFDISEYGAWLIGVLAAMVTFLTASFIIGEDLNTRNADGAREKTEQVQACTDIEDAVASLTCVQEINK